MRTLRIARRGGVTKTSLAGQTETADVSTLAIFFEAVHSTCTLFRIMAEYTAGSRRKSAGGTVTAECIQELLDFFIKSAYKAKNVDQRVGQQESCMCQLLELGGGV